MHLWQITWPYILKRKDIVTALTKLNTRYIYKKSIFFSIVAVKGINRTDYLQNEKVAIINGDKIYNTQEKFKGKIKLIRRNSDTSEEFMHFIYYFMDPKYGEKIFLHKRT